MGNPYIQAGRSARAMADWRSETRGWFALLAGSAALVLLFLVSRSTALGIGGLGLLALLILLARRHDTGRDPHTGQPPGGGSALTISDVLAKIQSAGSLKVGHCDANCAVCYKPGYQVIAIYAPRGETIPLCAKHFQEVEPTVQGRLAELKKK